MCVFLYLFVFAQKFVEVLTSFTILFPILKMEKIQFVPIGLSLLSQTLVWRIEHEKLNAERNKKKEVKKLQFFWEQNKKARHCQLSFPTRFEDVVSTFDHDEWGFNKNGTQCTNIFIFSIVKNPSPIALWLSYSPTSAFATKIVSFSIFFGALKKRKKLCILRTKKQCRMSSDPSRKNKFFIERPKGTMERLLSFFTFKNQTTKNLL